MKEDELDGCFIKLALGIIIMILMSICTKLDAQVNLHIGDSQTKGTVGVEFQYGNVSLSGGYRPIPMREYDHTIWYHAYCGAFTIYEKPKGFNSYFFTAGMTSIGAFYKASEKFGYQPEPAVSALLGLRFYPHTIMFRASNKLSLDFGGGVNMSNHMIWGAIEFTVNYQITN